MRTASPDALGRATDRPAASSAPRTSALSRQLTSPRLVTIAAALSITIVRLPIYFGAKTVLNGLILLMLAVCVWWGVPRQRRGSFANWQAAIVFFYAALIAIALFRGAKAGVFGTTESAASQSLIYLLFVAFGIVLLTTARTKSERRERFLAIALAPAVYVVVNTLMNFAGLQNSAPMNSTDGTTAEMLRTIGISAVRTRFPLALSINLYSIIVAAALASVIVLRLRTSSLPSRKIAWLIVGACMYCILLGDSRAALLIALIVIALFAVRIRLPAIGVAGLIPLLPLIIVGLLNLVSSGGGDAALSRGTSQTEELATGTGRLYIWEGAWGFLKHFPFEEIYGWGASGHVTSGAYLHYVLAFGGDAHDTALFTHDIVLQTLLDTGLIGLAALVLVVWVTWRTLRRHLELDPRSPAIALLAILLVIILSGGTEVSPTYYSQEALLEVLLIGGAAAGLASSKATVPEFTVKRKARVRPAYRLAEQPTA